MTYIFFNVTHGLYIAAKWIMDYTWITTFINWEIPHKWKFQDFNRKFIYNWTIFHCHDAMFD